MWTTILVQVRVVSRKIYCNSRSEMIVMLKGDTNFKGNIKLGFIQATEIFVFVWKNCTCYNHDQLA